jgi:hypothetical protein
MAEKGVSCPYCILADDFRPMLQRPGWIICERCGHVVIPDDPEFRCSCPKCLELHRAA